MRKIFVCSPYRGNVTQNVAKAKKYAREIALSGNMPIVPHLYFTQFLSDKINKERSLGIELGCSLIQQCDELRVYGETSKGMEIEIAKAHELGVPVVYFER